MAQKRKNRSGPGRPPVFDDPVYTAFWMEREDKERLYEQKGTLPVGVYVGMLLRSKNAEKAILMRKVAEKDEEIKALKKENEELKRLVERLQNELEKSGAIPAREREARDLRDEVQRVLSMYPELKLLELFRRLGYSEKGEALMKKAEAFQKRWFVLEGKVFVSKELGLVLEPSHEVGLLGWKVKKLEVNADV